METQNPAIADIESLRAIKKIIMTLSEAKKYARNKTLKGTAIILAILILLLLLGETRGDFANGLIFFLDAITNIHTIIIIILLFGLTYYFAGNAGESIIIEKQNILLVSLKYTTLISLAISVYVVLISVFREKDFSLSGFERMASIYFLGMFLKTCISLLIVWLWATNKMRSVKVLE